MLKLIKVIFIAVLCVCCRNAVFASDTDKFLRNVTLTMTYELNGETKVDSLRNDLMAVYTYDRELILTTSREVKTRVRVYDARIGDVYYDRTVDIFPTHVCQFYYLDEQFMLDVTIDGVIYSAEFYFDN